MKKLFGLFALLGVLVLAACSNVTEKYAEKVMEEKLS
jgi:protein involved in sex pheromone biosynthesis